MIASTATPPAPGGTLRPLPRSWTTNRHPTRARGNLFGETAGPGELPPPHPRPGEPSPQLPRKVLQGATPPAPGGTFFLAKFDQFANRHPTRARGNHSQFAPGVRYAPPPHPRPGEPTPRPQARLQSDATPPAPGGTLGTDWALIGSRRHPTRARGNPAFKRGASSKATPPHPRPGEPIPGTASCVGISATPPAPGGTNSRA